MRVCRFPGLIMILSSITMKVNSRAIYKELSVFSNYPQLPHSATTSSEEENGKVGG